MIVHRLADYSYILLTILFTVYGQLILKWRVGYFGELPVSFVEKIKFIMSLVFDPWIFSGLLAAFLASLAWMAAMTKFELNYAYPFMSLNFVLVLILSVFLLNEPITFARTLGVSLIVLGTIVASQ